MSERNGPDRSGFSDASLDGTPSFGERRYFIDPVLLETTMADAVMWSGVIAGGGVFVAGMGIGWYFYKKGEAVDRETQNLQSKSVEEQQPLKT